MQQQFLKPNKKIKQNKRKQHRFKQKALKTQTHTKQTKHTRPQNKFKMYPGAVGGVSGGIERHRETSREVEGYKSGRSSGHREASRDIKGGNQRQKLSGGRPENTAHTETSNL